MPNRIIREGWLESEKIAKLDPKEERFFLRLCLRADDFGRFHSNPLLLKASLFPLCDDARSTDIPRWLAACELAGLVRCYTAENKPCVEILNFRQRSRAATSRFPQPPDGPPANAGPMSDTCQTDDRPPRTYSYSETDSKTETETGPPAARGSRSPTTKNALQLRAEKLHGKRESTPWDRSELKAWEGARPVVEATSEEEWLLLEWFYGLPQSQTFARKALAQTLNNWSGEIQRALAHKEGAGRTSGSQMSDTRQTEIPGWRPFLIARAESMGRDSNTVPQTWAELSQAQREIVYGQRASVAGYANTSS